MIPSLQLILTGLGIGLLVAAPVGPVNILCIQRSLERGFWGGLAAGMGAILGDGLLALLAAIGFTAISDVIVAHKPEIKLVGGLVLILFGLKLFNTEPRDNTVSELEVDHHGFLWTVSQTLLLTLTNPGAVLGMFAIFGGVSTALGGIDTFTDAGIIVLAVMAGSLIWWTTLSRVIASLRHKLTDRRLQMINQIAGGCLVAFGLALIVETGVRWLMS